jgi:hypothetical protein
MFLGMDRSYHAIPWFSPGQVDVHLAAVEGIEAADPLGRVVIAILRMLAKILDVVGAHEHDPAEEWMPEVSAIVGEYARKVLGIPAGTCAVKG